MLRLFANSSDGTPPGREWRRIQRVRAALRSEENAPAGLGRRASNAVITQSALLRYRDMVSKLQPTAGNQLPQAGDLG